MQSVAKIGFLLRPDKRSCGEEYFALVAKIFGVTRIVFRQGSERSERSESNQCILLVKMCALRNKTV